MASTRFAGLVIGVIIVSLALKYSLACAHQGTTTRKGKWVAGIASQNHASSDQNDFLDEVSAAAIAHIGGRKGLRGIKMGVLNGLSKKQSERKQGLVEKPKISGNYGSKRTSKGAAQDDDSMEAKIPAEGMRFPNPTTLDPLQDTSKSFLDAGHEVAKVMHDDYTGKETPHRTPPVNNYEPRD